MSYTLILTDDDWRTIHFVGGRYSWSAALLKHYNGGTVCHDEDCDMADGTHRIRLREHEAWALQEAFEEDTEGGHSMFPMLACDSELYGKLSRFLESIV